MPDGHYEHRAAAAARGLASLSQAAAAERATPPTASPPPPTTNRRRRPHATRSCLACRKRKVRCLLANTDVPSSRDPLSASDACQRCNHMRLECVVWDGDRRGSRYSRPSSEAAAAAVAPMKRQRMDSADESMQTEHGDELLSPFYPFDPTFEAHDGGGQHDDAPTQNTTPDSATATATQTPQTTSKQGRVRLYSIMRRPMLMLHVLLSRQNVFRVGVPGLGGIGGLDAANTALAEIAKTVGSTSVAGDVMTCDLPLLVQHIHLPMLQQSIAVFVDGERRASIAEALLLAVMLYLCGGGGRGGGGGGLPANDAQRLGHLIRFYARHVLVRAPNRIEAAQALELMAVHMPYIMDGEDSADGAGDRRLVSDDDDSTAGASMLAIATKIATSLADRYDAYDAVEDRSESVELRALKISLCCWSSALGFQDARRTEGRASAPAVWLSHSLDEYGVVLGSAGGAHHTAVAHAGRRALRLRCQALALTANCEAALEGVMEQTALANELVKQRHIDILDRYDEDMQDVDAERVLALESALKTDCRDVPGAAPLVQVAYLCNEIEASGMHRSLLTRALADVHARVQREEDGRRGVRSAFPDPDVRVWDHPTWRDHVGVIGKRRNDGFVRMLAKACRLKTMAKQGSSSAGILLPATYVCALLVCAAKALVDTQTVMLLAWRHVHVDTDSYVVTLNTLAETLQQRALWDATGVGACTAGLLRVMASTMTSWQDRQAVVLARARLERQSAMAAVAATTTTTTTTTKSAEFFAGSDAMLDSLFDGIIEVPDWQALMQSLDAGTVV